jgi:predicted RNA-binding protein with PUA-like domain
MKTKMSERKYWIMKSEPEAFSIDDLQRLQVSSWDGIRNYQVRNFIRDNIKIGDRSFFYHSNAKEIGIVGEMEIVSESYPDHAQFDKDNIYYDSNSKTTSPRWLAFDVEFKEKFPHVLTLSSIKLNSDLADLPIVKKGNRLSIVPISEGHYNTLKKLVQSI